MRLPCLLDELDIGRANGRCSKLLKQLAKIDALVIDEWVLAVLDDTYRHDLLEVRDDRHRTLTIVTSQLSIEHWRAAIGDATLAGVTLDSRVHNAHQLNLKADLMRKNVPV